MTKHVYHAEVLEHHVKEALDMADGSCSRDILALAELSISQSLTENGWKISSLEHNEWNITYLAKHPQQEKSSYWRAGVRDVEELEQNIGEYLYDSELDFFVQTFVELAELNDDRLTYKEKNDETDNR